MKLLSLELIGYKRFQGTGISHFKMDITALLQTILGSNGSGKSSLLDALSPYPPVKADFEKGGKWEETLEHRGHMYRLVANFNGGGGRHEFWKDDVNLNTGGTSTVQKELVERELNFSQQIHELLTGQVTFTNMSPAQRREWITKISNLDLDFALGMYSDVRTSLRDTQGALKHNETRLGRESQRVVEGTDLDAMRKRADGLNGDIMFLMGERKRDVLSVPELNERLKDNGRRIMQASDQIMKCTPNCPEMHRLKTLESVQEYTGVLIGDIKGVEGFIVDREEQLLEVRETIRQLEAEGAVDLPGLEAKLATLYEQQSKVDVTADTFTIEGDLRALLQDTLAVRVPLSEFVSTLSGPTLKVPPRGDWDVCREKRTSKHSEKVSVENRINGLRNRISTIEDSRDVDCPKCSYRWKPGVSENTLNELRHAEREGLARKVVLEKELEVLDVTLGNIDIRHSEQISWRSLVRSYPRLRTLWTAVGDAKLLTEAPDGVMGLYDRWEKAVRQSIGLDTMRREIEDVEGVIERLKSGGSHDVNYFHKRECKLHEEIAKANNDKDRLRASLTNVRKYHDDLKLIADNTSTIAKCLEDVNSIHVQSLESRLQAHINETLRRAQGELATLQQRLNESEALATVLADLKKSIESLKLEFKAYQMLEKALSPQEGVIASTMTHFINALVKQLNGVFSRIWEYDMKILPCDFGQSDLTYKFALSVQNDSQIVPDISKASLGQREVINYAFTLAVMAYLDLQDYPLFLDELGSSFDEAHRSKLVHFNKWLLDNGQCSQIFYISHFIAEHGGLINGEVCVLDSANIAVPEGHNQHVTMS